jgi:vitamin B12 transporter
MPQALPPPDPPAQAIIVTGRALPDPASERAYSVESLDPAELHNAPSRQLDEVLKQVPGLQLFRRSDSTSGHPTSQGVTLRALGGNAASRVLLVLDGVPQTDPFGGWVNWPAYDPAGLERVRIVRGGGSVAHGQGALAGVIDASSLTAERADVSVEGGSRQSLIGRGYFGVEADAGLFTLNVRGSRGSGFVPLTKETRGSVDRRAPFREGSVRGRWMVPISSHVELQGSGLAFVDVRERGIPYTDNRTRGLDGSVRLIGSGRWEWSATGYAQWRNFRSSFASVDDQRTTATRVSLQDSVPSTGIGGSVEIRPPTGRAVELRVGADARLMNGETRELYAFTAGQPTRRRIAGGESTTAGLFAEGVLTRRAVTLTGGVRLDHWSIWEGMLVERVILTGDAIRDEHYPSRTGWRPTGRAAVLIDLNGGLSLRSAAYLGWRLPTLNELFRPFRAGADATAANPQLDPERLAGAEAGVEYRKDGIDIALTAFVNRLAGAVANVTLGDGPGTFPGVGFVAGAFRQRQNLDAVKVRGVEASGEVRSGAWSIRLGAAYNDAEVESQGLAAALNKRRPAQTPAFTLSGNLTWQDHGRTAALEIRRTGAQYEDDLNERRLPAATTVGGFFAWPLTRKLQVVARGENLLGETVVAGIGDDGAVEQATPRTIWLGLAFRVR